jgi:hypothetical protein
MPEQPKTTIQKIKEWQDIAAGKITVTVVRTYGFLAKPLWAFVLKIKSNSNGT